MTIELHNFTEQFSSKILNIIVTNPDKKIKDFNEKVLGSETKFLLLPLNDYLIPSPAENFFMKVNNTINYGALFTFIGLLIFYLVKGYSLKQLWNSIDSI